MDEGYDDLAKRHNDAWIAYSDAAKEWFELAFFGDFEEEEERLQLASRAALVEALRLSREVKAANTPVSSAGGGA